jgi:dolichyl-phosphate beta-glucosyltransferase
MEPYLSLVVPAYNEAASICSTLSKMRTYLDKLCVPYEIIVSADGVDGTREKAAELAQGDNRISVIGSRERGGKGRGIRNGMARTRGAIVGFVDADYKTPIEELEKILPWLERGFDVVIGSRALPESCIEVPQPWYRRLGSQAFGIGMHLTVGLWNIHDTQCGFKFFRGSVGRELFARQLIDGYMFDVEILNLAVMSGYRIKEVPIRWRDDGDSRLELIAGNWRNFLDILRIRFGSTTLGAAKTLSSSHELEFSAYQYQDLLDRQEDLYAHTKYEMILSRLGGRSSLEILNAGCGSGDLSLLLARAGHRVVGIDAVPEYVAIAERRAAGQATPARCTFLTSTIEDFESERSFDCVVATDVLEHIRDDRAAFAKLVRLLRPEGEVVVTVPAGPRLFGYHDEQLGHFRRYSSRSLRRVADGLCRIESMRYFGFSLVPVCYLYSKVLRRPYPVRESGSGLTSPILRALLRMEKAVPMPFGTSLLMRGIRE